MTSVDGGVGRHLLDNRCMIINKRGVRPVVDKTRKLAGNRIT
jgi:hypothetical protein